MGFISIASAVYDYQPQSAEELEIKEGELLYILEKDGSDDWWKARKRATEEDEDEPEGLIPNNYVEDAKPTHKARALYDYTRQTDEEVSFPENASIDIYDMSDPDWTLVGINGEFGFAPANYIEIAGESEQQESEQPQTPVAAIRSPISSPAANLARVIGASPTATRPIPSPPQEREPSPEPEEAAPALPRRPPSQSISSPKALDPPAQRIRSVSQQEQTNTLHHTNYYEEASEPDRGIAASPPYNRAAHFSEEESMRSPGGFHLYNISEMVSVMGRRKKMPTTLGLNVATGTIMLSPEKTRDGPTQEWTADKLSHYSIEGKHVFLELVRPSKSLDLHAGAKDTAQEIVGSLGEIAGAHRAEGFKEVLAAASGGGGGQKKGVVLYDFMAQGDDEVTVAVGDDIIILDDEKSEEWWNVRRLKNGSEGVMPSSYIEITGIVTEASRSGLNAGRSVVDQNRAEEERLAKKAAAEPKIELPARGSSLGEERLQKEKKSSKTEKRSKPDPAKVRTWTDHSGSFKVEAQFIGVSDGKINLHKVNGVKIAVPVTKMSPEDIEYVEKVTNESIDEHIPVADLIKMKRKGQAGGSSGASVEPTKKTPDYDWFEFFLSAGVGPHQCERYAQAMVKDSMDETVLPDITTDTLRTLGLKEGDALKVMKFLDQKYRSSTNGNGNGIFSGPGGALHNNTRRGRPETNRATTDTVDAAAFEDKSQEKKLPEPSVNGNNQSFDDDAWEVKKSQTPITQTPVAPPPPASANIAALSLLDKPLEPTPAPQPTPQAPPQHTAISPAPQQSQQTGANPAFFGQINQVPQVSLPRQRPQPPQQNFNSSLLQPPPRPTSAPQIQHNQFGVQQLQVQHTGLPSIARPAPSGQSLDELTAQRMQQYLQPQATGFVYQNSMIPQATGFPQFQYQQPYLNGNINGSPFADPRPLQPQPTAFLQPGPAPGSLNSVLPPALQPQKTSYLNGLQPQPTGFVPPTQQGGGYPLSPTGFQPQLPPQATGFQPQLQPQATGYGQNGFGGQQSNFGTQLPPVPAIPRHIPAPLTPQKTGPAPTVKFGVQNAKKLVPQPTGRANLANATPQNPFGF